MAEENHRWMIEAGRLSDFKLICQGKEIHAHKTMLASHSKYFETLFNSGFKVENRDGVVVFEDVESELMRHLLDYFYKGTTEWNVPLSDLVLHVQLWILADRLEARTVMFTVGKRIMNALRSYKQDPCHKSHRYGLRAPDLSRRCSSYVGNALGKYHDLAIMTTWLSWRPGGLLNTPNSAISMHDRSKLHEGVQRLGRERAGVRHLSSPAVDSEGRIMSQSHSACLPTLTLQHTRK
ncbi:BTB/POZ domain-containing protein [Colletotrichum salicis]|uniref:BTB/POZ domain-containing protein n=1 Tax=Colletotrichum salicis TaxID=1209931 RepID=A0A135UP78_9PEZI|nr:BTB/POZ domain-containing protein [Colletotrichum salicis]